MGAQYLTAEGGKLEDRNGTRERGRRILGDEVEGMITVRGRAGKGERKIKIRQGFECYSPISTGVTLCLTFGIHTPHGSPNSCGLLLGHT